MNAIIIIEILKFIKICLLVLFRIFNVFYNNVPLVAAFITISHYALKEVRHFFQTHFLYVFKEQLL